MSIPFTWVYLVCDLYTGLFKIGQSDDPERRVTQLRRAPNGSTILAAPQDYHLVEAWICEAVEETNLHRRYKSFRLRGEWFDLDQYAVSDLHRYMRRYRRLVEGEHTYSEESYMQCIFRLEEEVARLEAENDVLRVYTGQALADKPVLLLNSSQEVVVA